MTPTPTPQGAEPREDGWIEWTGGDTDAAPITGEIEWLNRHGDQNVYHDATKVMGWRKGHRDQIIAYRVVSPAPAAPTNGGGVATDELVDRFAAALKEKLRAAEAKYGWNDGWLSANWQSDCIEQLRAHVEKGDPRDVAAYCAFAWHHGWPTSALQRQPTQQGGTERDEALEWFVKVVNGGGSHGVPAGDNHCALDVFCDDRGNADDTYNLSEGLGYTRTSHSGWGDGCATAFITDAGKAFLAALKTSEV